jgi:hypothetical protein
VAPPRTSWRRRPLLVLIILILLLVIGYVVRAVDGGTRSGSWPAGSHVSGPQLVTSSAGSNGLTQPASTAQDGGRFAAKAAMPSCACGPAK